jgi:hypothetical protein
MCKSLARFVQGKADIWIEFESERGRNEGRNNGWEAIGHTMKKFLESA